MAEVITSIGSDTDTGTATPTSCGTGGGSSGYSVNFASGALSGVARGDMVTMYDDGAYFATFTYRVASIEQSPARATLVYVTDDMWTGDTSPCDLLDSSWEQAECNFGRFYTSIYEWHEELGLTFMAQGTMLSASATTTPHLTNQIQLADLARLIPLNSQSIQIAATMD